jgi:hypothetical protein
MHKPNFLRSCCCCCLSPLLLNSVSLNFIRSTTTCFSRSLCCFAYPFFFHSPVPLFFFFWRLPRNLANVNHKYSLTYKSKYSTCASLLNEKKGNRMS